MIPTRLWFGPVSPNPSSGEVTFRFDLPATSEVHLAILDIAGRVVDEVRDHRPAGRHTLVWGGWGDLRRARHAGIYFARLEVNGRPLGTRRLVVLR